MEYRTFATLLPEMRAPGDYKRLDNKHYIDLVNYMIYMAAEGHDLNEHYKLSLMTDIQKMIIGIFSKSYDEYNNYNKLNKCSEFQLSRMNNAILSYHIELYRFINGDSPVGSAAPIAYLTQMRMDLKDDRQERLMKWPAIHFSELLIDKKPVLADQYYVGNVLLNQLVTAMRKYDSGKNFSSMKTVAEVLKRNLNNQNYIYGLIFRLFHANCVIEQPNLKGNENGII